MSLHRARAIFPQDEISKDFYLARATALDIYARVEQSLLRLYAHLTGMEVDVAGITFFRINNSRSTISIIQSLLKKKYGRTYNLFWNSLAKHLTSLADNRNLIVHRSVGVYLEGETINKVALITANWEDRSSRSEIMELEKLEDFIVKAYFIFRVVSEFNSHLKGIKNEPWHDIFQQPLTYPPNSDHPLYEIDAN